MVCLELADLDALTSSKAFSVLNLMILLRDWISVILVYPHEFLSIIVILSSAYSVFYNFQVWWNGNGVFESDFDA